jgi:predicted nucleotidyltransferase
MGTIVLIMSTPNEPLGLLECLFGKTRRSILALLYGHCDESFHLRKILRLTDVSPGAGQRELKRLSDAGIITRILRENQVHFQADPRCPIFEELKAIVTKTQGVADILRSALGPLSGSIRAAAIIGSVASGTATRASDIDVLIIGDAAFADVVEKLGPAQDVLRREINPIVMSESEFRGRTAEGDHFLTSVLDGTLIPLLGDTDELVRMAGERVAP